MRVLLTGAAGFIGSAVARALADSGDEVVPVDDIAVGDIINALSKFTEVSFVVLFIAGGLSVGRMLTDPTWAFFRYIDFDHELVGEERPINN